MRAPPKDPSEVIDITFDFKSEIGAATISGSPLVAVMVDKGADAAVGAMTSGAAIVQGALVFQRSRFGLDGVDYYWRCTATLSDGRKLSRGIVIPVRDAGRRERD